MARNDIPNGWDKIRQNVQETERLIGQKTIQPVHDQGKTDRRIHG